MMKKNINLKLMLILGFLLLFGCQPKPSIQPEQVNAEFLKTKAVLDELNSLNLPEKMVEHYQELFQQAENAKKQKNYDIAIELAKKISADASELLQVWRDQASKYAELQSYNPPETLTYHYRNLMSQAETAGKQGNVDLAKDLAKQASEQAGLSLQVWKDQIATLRTKLDQAREQLENLYPVNYLLIGKYWELEAQYQKREFQTVMQKIDAFIKEITDTRQMSIVLDRSIVVNAPPEYIKQWGNARIYQEITPEGKLKTVVDTVPNGMRVKFIKVKLFSPELTFYYVEVPSSQKQGWISEKYLNVGEARY